MRSHALRRAIPTAALLVTLIASTPSAAAPRQDGAKGGVQDASGRQDELQQLNHLLDEIRKLIKSHVSPAKVEQRLKARTAHYRTIKGKVEDLGKKPETKPANPVQTGVTKPSKARLLGDQEKQGLADGTVMLVDGRELSEADIRDLAKYLASFKGGTVEDHITEALGELIVIRAMQAKFKDRLSDLEKSIESLRKRAAAGEDFATLAKEHSDGPSKTRGGALDMSDRNTLTPSFARWAFTLSPGKISPVFVSPFGYHILKVTERNKGATPDADQVRCSHILKSFAPDPSTLRNLIQRAKSGQVDIACIDDGWRKLLPQAYK